MFISQLIVEHHARVSRKPSQEEIAAELRRLADLLEEVNQKTKTFIDFGSVSDIYKSRAFAQDSDFALRSTVIDAPSGRVGVTVLAEETGKR